MINRKIVLFDFDGVIVSTFELCYSIARKQMPGLEPENYRRFFEGNIYRVDWASEGIAPRDNSDDFFTEYTPRLMEHVLVPGIATVVATLVGRYTLIIVSSTVEPAIDAFLQAHGLRPFFADILGRNASESKSVKVRMVLERYGAADDDCLMITDTLGDLREAAAVGVRGLAVAWGFHGREILMQGSPVAIVEEPAALVGVVDAYWQN
ncbi:MAG: HAD hydrolase-like protein [Patescibacteria group bacterium]|nr:HAD hydrolase-like protein [Patescibacteria group bacterium]